MAEAKQKYPTPVCPSCGSRHGSEGGVRCADARPGLVALLLSSLLLGFSPLQSLGLHARGT